VDLKSSCLTKTKILFGLVASVALFFEQDVGHIEFKGLVATLSLDSNE
jgi:hypothetical protein